MDEGLGIAVRESRLCFADMAWLAPQLHARVMRGALVEFHPVAPRFGQRLPSIRCVAALPRRPWAIR
jgi:hypothetical protein